MRQVLIVHLLFVILHNLIQPSRIVFFKMPTEEFNIIANSACTNNNGAPTLLFFYDHLFLCTHVHRLYNVMYLYDYYSTYWIEKSVLTLDKNSYFANTIVICITLIYWVLARHTAHPADVHIQPFFPSIIKTFWWCFVKSNFSGLFGGISNALHSILVTTTTTTCYSDG